MRSRSDRARPGFVLIFTALCAGCSGGGGGTAQVQPPPASRAQTNAIDAPPAGAADPAADTGTLLPLSVLAPRSASGVTPMAITACSTTAACIGGTNSGTGAGVAGASSGGKGVTGTTTFASTSTTSQYGVYGQDSSTTGSFDAGVYGLSVRGIGVSGKSTSNYGVRGTSSSGVAVYGTSATNMGVVGNGSTRGVYGTTAASSGIGVYGNSSTYIGVYGRGAFGLYGSGTSYGAYASTSSGYGGYFSSSSGTAAQGSSATGTGVYASSSTGYGLQAHTGGSVGAYVTNSNGNGGDVTGTYIGLVARAPSGGFPLVATDSSGNNVFYVTGTGDVYYHGGIHTFAATSSGAQALAYSPQATRPSIQDTGTAQLINGRAVVMLDPTFARTIDTQRAYQVFLTPGGDTRGLYVAAKTPSQFVVREVQGGRGAFPFDYQITAIAAGKGAERMSIVRPNAHLLRPPASDARPSGRPQQ